jgi:hypothetical protein
MAALSGVQTAAAGDFDRLRVADVIPLPGMMASPGKTALLLSPDGGLLLHLAPGGDGLCLYGLAGGTPRRLRCATPDGVADNVEGPFWSPDGSRATWPNWSAALMRLRDTDLQVLDLATMMISGLTDDGFDGRFTEGAAPVDPAAGWQDADTVLFVRLNPSATDAKVWPLAALYSVGMDGTVTEPFAAIGGRGWPNALAVAPDGRAVAFVLDDRKRPEDGGLFLLRLGDAAPIRTVPITALAGAPRALAFSADGGSILASTPSATGIAAMTVDVETGRASAFHPGERLNAAGCSPTGRALVHTVQADPGTGGGGGLFLPEPPGAPGRLLHPGTFTAPHCCTQILSWARNDTILPGNTKTHDQPVLPRLVR